jgi:hypothetical protein
MSTYPPDAANDSPRNWLPRQTKKTNMKHTLLLAIAVPSLAPVVVYVDY